MKSALRGGTAALLLVSLASVSGDIFAQAPRTGLHHTVIAADGIQWKQLRPGAEIAVVSGDPDTEGSPLLRSQGRYGDELCG